MPEPSLEHTVPELDGSPSIAADQIDPRLAAPTATVGTEAAPLTKAEAKRARRKRQWSMYFAIFWLGLVFFLAAFADFLPFVKAYDEIDASYFKKGPTIDLAPPFIDGDWFQFNFDHPMGTDKIGRDVFARTVYGARLSIIIASASITLGLLFGGLFGLWAGYYGKLSDRVISTVMDIMLAFPALILALSITSFLGRDAKNVVLALSILSIPPLTRIVRAVTMNYSTREFVVAARGLGAQDKRILVREILPNVVPSMLTFALTGLAVLVIAEGALAFLGQSVPPPVPTWGLIIGEGRQELETAWWIALLPAAVLFLTVLSFNLLGDVVAKRFDIREASL